MTGLFSIVGWLSDQLKEPYFATEATVRNSTLVGNPMPYSPFEIRLGDERLRGLYRYWRLVRGRRFAPGRSDIDPRDIPSLVPILALIDVSEDARFRFRLAGDEVTAQFGRGLIGKTVEQVLRGQSCHPLLQLFGLVVERRRPAFWDGESPSGQADARLSRFAAPLAGKGGQVTMLLAGQVAYFGPGGPELLIAERPGGMSEAVDRPAACDDGRPPNAASMAR